MHYMHLLACNAMMRHTKRRKYEQLCNHLSYELLNTAEQLPPTLGYMSMSVSKRLRLLLRHCLTLRGTKHMSLRPVLSCCISSPSLSFENMVSLPMDLRKIRCAECQTVASIFPEPGTGVNLFKFVSPFIKVDLHKKLKGPALNRNIKEQFSEKPKGYSQQITDFRKSVSHSHQFDKYNYR